MTRLATLVQKAGHLTLWAVVAAVCLPTAATAAGFRISPVRLDLSTADPSTQVNLTNLGKTAVAVQVRAYRWAQVDGVDSYEQTKDIFFAPPIVTIPPSGQVSVRLRLRAKAPEKIEGSYRVYFQELPPADGGGQGAGTTLRVRFGIPLFVRPSSPIKTELDSSVTLADGRAMVTLRNSGTEHLKIEAVELHPAKVDRSDASSVPVSAANQSTKGAAYLLPGSQLDWAVPVAADFNPAAHVLRVRTDDRSGRPGSGIGVDGWFWTALEMRSPGAPSGPSPKP